MATYNGEKYIREQLDSIISQTFEDWVLIIHDDGSTDSTVEILLEYKNKYKEKIVLIEDGIILGGAKSNFAHLMSFSDSQYIMFCDQDDIWLENRIELFYAKMLESENIFHDEPIVIFSDLVVVDEHLNVISNSMVESQKLNPIIAQTSDSLKCQNVITGCAMMFNKKALTLSLPIPKSALMHDWWIGLVTSKYGKNIFLNQPTILYRQHANNQVGFKKLNAHYIFKVVFSKKIYNDYVNIKAMMYDFGIKTSFLSFFICKVKTILLRYFK